MATKLITGTNFFDSFVDGQGGGATNYFAYGLLVVYLRDEVGLASDTPAEDESSAKLLVGSTASLQRLSAFSTRTRPTLPGCFLRDI